jgi:hypothetical protein
MKYLANLCLKRHRKIIKLNHLLLIAIYKNTWVNKPNYKRVNVNYIHYRMKQIEIIVQIFLFLGQRIVRPGWD